MSETAATDIAGPADSAVLPEPMHSTTAAADRAYVQAARAALLEPTA